MKNLNKKKPLRAPGNWNINQREIILPLANHQTFIQVRTGTTQKEGDPARHLPLEYFHSKRAIISRKNSDIQNKLHQKRNGPNQLATWTHQKIHLK